jgi:prenyl protein peptidase
MCPLLLAGGYGITLTIVCSPLFFGAAHLHHIIQHLHKTGRELRSAILEVGNFNVENGNHLNLSVFQLFYTTIFGMYSTFLFLRTGQIIALFFLKTD